VRKVENLFLERKIELLLLERKVEHLLAKEKWMGYLGCCFQAR
jgi:hypothetical protein